MWGTLASPLLNNCYPKKHCDLKFDSWRYEAANSPKHDENYFKQRYIFIIPRTFRTILFEKFFTKIFNQINIRNCSNVPHNSHFHVFIKSTMKKRSLQNAWISPDNLYIIKLFSLPFVRVQIQDCCSPASSSRRRTSVLEPVNKITFLWTASYVQCSPIFVVSCRAWKVNMVLLWRNCLFITLFVLFRCPYVFF